MIDGGMGDNPRVALYQTRHRAVIANKMNDARRHGAGGRGRANTASRATCSSRSCTVPEPRAGRRAGGL